MKINTGLEEMLLQRLGYNSFLHKTQVSIALV